jgi:GR25 family glycosyltransferase involved in LPS biosynthesis
MSESKSLYLYVIHTQAQTFRAARIHGVIQGIRTTAIKRGYNVNVRMILSPDPSDMHAKIQEYQGNVCYDPLNDPRFDELRQVLSVEMISNIEKHRDAWRRIAALDVGPKDLCMVIEDDVFQPNDAMQSLEELLDTHDAHEWDMLFLGLTNMSTPASEKLTVHPLHDLGPMLPAKDSYVLKPALAKQLSEKWDKYRFILRVQLSWMFKQLPEARIMFPSKRVFMDGSKVGMVPSCIHPSNLLIFNREYMQLYHMLALPKEELMRQMPKIKSIFETVRSLQSPDVLHIFGVLLFKAGRMDEAEASLLSAVENMKKQQGIVNSRSDLMNNLVQLYEHKQTDLAKICSKPSKYADPMMARSDLATV